MSTIIVWALGYFPHNEALTEQQQQEQSYIGRIGQTVEPVFELQGFSWKMDVGLLAGVGAKEIVASTMGVLYANDESLADDSEVGQGESRYENCTRSWWAMWLRCMVWHLRMGVWRQWLR